MANLFHHHAENDLIRVECGPEIYVDRVDAFAIDNGAKVPVLPLGAIERIYEPGIRHAISDSSSTIAAGPQPWPYGDATIAAVSSLRVAQAKRTAPPPKVAPPSTATGSPSGTTTVAS